MILIETDSIIEEYLAFVKQKEFPCVGAKAALAKLQIQCMVAGNMACPKDDGAILNFLYGFINKFRDSEDLFHSAAIIFKATPFYNEEQFEEFLWQRLQALADLDAKSYGYDTRVDADPNSAKFSFSIKEEGFFIIGLHPASSRIARQFKYPTLVFNPHTQFEKLREEDRYEQMKQVVRKRDIAFSGSVNPMLDDFGKSSEVYQYSGKKYDETWQCPLKINHANTKNNSST